MRSSFLRVTLALMAAVVLCSGCSTTAAPTAPTASSDDVVPVEPTSPSSPSSSADMSTRSTGPSLPLVGVDELIATVSAQVSDPTDDIGFLMACMEFFGFSGTPNQGGILFDVPPEQMELHLEANSVCRSAYATVAGIDMGPFDEETLTEWYWAYVGTYECLVEHGYPTSPPPSLEEYIESGGEVWHPYNEMYLTNQEPTDEQLLFETCPQDLDVLLADD